MREIKETFFGSPRSSIGGVGLMLYGVYEGLPPDAVEFLKQYAAESPGLLRAAILVLAGGYGAAYCRDSDGRGGNREDHN